MSDRVIVTLADGIAEVTMNRADKRNALDGDMFLALEEAGERLKTESGVRAVVLHGDGKSFCAGLDMSSMTALANAGDQEQRDAQSSRNGNPGRIDADSITHLGQQVCWVWQEIPVPVIAAVHGHALGGGLQIALGADIRIVHPDTKMSVREVYWGLVPDMTGTFQLSKLVRPDVARELTYTARIFSGAEGHEMGLVTRVSEDPLPVQGGGVHDTGGYRRVAGDAAPARALSRTGGRGARAAKQGGGRCLPRPVAQVASRYRRQGAQPARRRQPLLEKDLEALKIGLIDLKLSGVGAALLLQPVDLILVITHLNSPL